MSAPGRFIAVASASCFIMLSAGISSAPQDGDIHAEPDTRLATTVNYKSRKMIRIDQLAGMRPVGFQLAAADTGTTGSDTQHQHWRTSPAMLRWVNESGGERTTSTFRF